MNITQVIIASIIFGIINSTMIVWGLSFIRDIEQRKEYVYFTELKKEIIDFYDYNGVLPSNLNDLKGDSRINTLLEDKDKFNNKYEYIVNNFSFGNVNDGKIIVVSKGPNNILDSTFSSGVFVPSEKETFSILSDSDLNGTKRRITKNTINVCSSSVYLYLSVTNSTSVTANDLILSGYIQPLNLYDSWGNLLNISTDGCYSIGPNKIDNNKGVDDVW